jgi:asparagine synthase (glutamine-hydrolysing)
VSGFVGVVGPACTWDEREWLERATAYMAFRGPDHQQTWHDDHAGLGHSLLATTPEEKGSQQPASLDGEVWIAGDVRLDARLRLVRELRSRGCQASPALPDTELVLHAYSVWGDRCVERLTGDFAFAIWDRRASRLFAARDQFGGGQLFYAVVGEHLLFGNTLECLLLHPGVSDALDELAVGDYLARGTGSDSSATTFQQIRRVPPAHVLSWLPERCAISRYWSAPEAGAFLRYPKPGDYADRFRELLTESVSDRLRTTRLSLQLSGGMDSTSIAVVAHRLLQEAGMPFSLHALTVDHEELMPGEADYARQVAATLTGEHEVLLAASYPELDPAEPPDWLPPEPCHFMGSELKVDVGRRAARHARVVFTGIGGDPLLRFFPSYWLSWLAGGHLTRIGSAAQEHLRLFNRLPPLHLRSLVRERRLRRGEVRRPLPEWLEPAFVRGTELAERTRAARLRHWKGLCASGMATVPLWSNMFHWCDPGFTRLAVRFRHPFFSVALVDFVGSLPPLPWLSRKSILRESMRGLLPEPVRKRPKALLDGNHHASSPRRGGPAPAAVEFVERVQGLERFVRVDRLREALGRAQDPQCRLDPALTFSVSLAGWLRHRRRPQAREVPATQRRSHQEVPVGAVACQP